MEGACACHDLKCQICKSYFKVGFIWLELNGDYLEGKWQKETYVMKEIHVQSVYMSVPSKPGGGTFAFHRTCRHDVLGIGQDITFFFCIVEVHCVQMWRLHVLYLSHYTISRVH